MPFWTSIVVIAAMSTAGWVIVSIVESVSKSRSKRHEAQLELERDYLRRMLAEIEDIKAELARQRQEASP
jgi:molecular chaperone GrpE (heat shock protein)